MEKLNVQEVRFIRTDVWREGEWVDLWSAVHFLSGCSIGLGFFAANMYFLHFTAFAVGIITLLLLVCYEMWETIVKIEETLANRIMDVVVGIVGYSATFFILAPQLSKLFELLSFGAVLLINIGVSVVGWRASQKAATLKKRVLTRYAAQRARLLREKHFIQKRFRR